MSNTYLTRQQQHYKNLTAFYRKVCANEIFTTEPKTELLETIQAALDIVVQRIKTETGNTPHA